METEHPLNQAGSIFQWNWDAFTYGIDFVQRSAIFTDILIKRGDTYIEHLRSGQPPVLVFNYEMILNGRHLPRPVNYALVRIADRRMKHDKPSGGERRHEESKRPELPKRPIVIIDPRAGHGPGIGGSSRDSEIGMALDYGFTVYFILFFTEPFPGQTLADVEQAEARFMEEIAKLHPYADTPVIMGNCQAGWAAALLCANRPEITGPLVLNGAPLSYWAGVEGANPMRYKGGLLGGVWLNMLLSDLGYGKFDGAHLVANFESLNPANTLWTKQYNLYSQVDTEEERYLKFEKWWGGFFMMSEQEIHFIVNNLFVGNKLERGMLQLHENETVDIRNIESPILVFASRGDNITPPQQALNWIPRVYGSVEALKRAGQVIIYIIHEHIGHLGIFVSGSVARKEHHSIIGHFDMIDYLPSGLYEMVIEGDIKTGDFVARFEERTMEDITAMGDEKEDERNFEVVNAVSNFNENLYGVFLRPWVRMWTSEWSGELFRWLHPLRTQRYLISGMNPLMRPVKTAAASARKYRKPVAPDNAFLAAEKILSAGIKDFLDQYRDTRDRYQELLFQMFYDNDFVRLLYLPADSAKSQSEPRATQDSGALRKKAPPLPEEGGFAEGLIRGMIATIRSTSTISRRHYNIALDIAQTHRVLKKIRPSVFKRIVRAQARILEEDPERAMAAMAVLIPGKADRLETLGLLRRIALVDGVYTEREKALLESIARILKIPHLPNRHVRTAEKSGAAWS